MQFTLSTVLAMASALHVFASPVVLPQGNNDASADLSKRDVVGPSCGAHITQYQKNEDGNGDKYKVGVTLLDALGRIIGGTPGVELTEGQKFDLSSQLPYQFEVTVGAVDSDSILFDYAGQHWSSASSQCKFGGYENGNREGDCLFSC